MTTQPENERSLFVTEDGQPIVEVEGDHESFYLIGMLMGLKPKFKKTKRGWMLRLSIPVRPRS